MKDLRKKIDSLEEEILNCQHEINLKYDSAEEMEKQMENLEVDKSYSLIHRMLLQGILPLEIL